MNKYSKEALEKKFKRICQCFGLYDLMFCKTEEEAKIANNESPKLWNMDTSFYRIIKKFHENTKDENIELFKNNDLVLNKINNTNRWNLFVSNIDVTPRQVLKGEIGSAKSTVQQYLKTLYMFKLISIPDFKDVKSKIMIENKHFAFNLNFYGFYNADSIDDWLDISNMFYLITDGIKNDFKMFKHFSFSLFMSIVAFLDDPKNKILNPSDEVLNSIGFLKDKNENNEKDSLNKKLNLNEKLKKIWKETYSQLCEVFINKIKESQKLNSHNEILEYFLSTLETLLGIKNIDLSDYKTTDFVNYKGIINKEKEISKARSKLRDNILKARNKLNDRYYSDITPIDESINFIHDCIEQQEAAHIIAVSEIKKMIEKDEEAFEYLSNPNNGIIMDHIYHDAFDRGWINFNLKGEMIATWKWNEVYVDDNNNYKKYPLMKIKEEVFNDEMKNFIMEKYTNKK